SLPPLDEARSDYDIGVALVAKIEERAKAREVQGYNNFYGQPIRLDGVLDRVARGRDRTEDERMDQGLRSGAASGILPPGSNLEKLRETGYIRRTGWPLGRGAH